MSLYVIMVEMQRHENTQKQWNKEEEVN